MRRYTVFTLYGLVIALMVNAILYMIPSPFTKKELINVEVFSDIPTDILSDVGDNFKVGKYKIIFTNKFDGNNPAIVSDVKKVEDAYEYSQLLGYYSATAFCSDDVAVKIAGAVMKNNYNYDVYVVDLKKILEGFEEDKLWEDIGISIEGEIKVAALYTSKNDLYYNIIKQQIIAALSGKTELTAQVVDEYEGRAQALLDKMPLESKTSETDILFTCNQSQYAYTLDKTRYNIQIAFEPVACVPIYFCYNTDTTTELDEEQMAKDICDGTFAKEICARNPSNTLYSRNSYRTLNAMDTVKMALYK